MTNKHKPQWWVDSNNKCGKLVPIGLSVQATFPPNPPMNKTGLHFFCVCLAVLWQSWEFLEHTECMDEQWRKGLCCQSGFRRGYSSRMEWSVTSWIQADHSHPAQVYISPVFFHSCISFFLLMLSCLEFFLLLCWWHCFLVEPTNPSMLSFLVHCLCSVICLKFSLYSSKTEVESQHITIQTLLNTRKKCCVTVGVEGVVMHVLI